jgi:ABC-type protease/lipase transport system fused ATPase/permease subunit
MTYHAIYSQKARIKSKGIDGSDRLTGGCVCQRVKKALDLCFVVIHVMLYFCVFVIYLTFTVVCILFLLLATWLLTQHINKRELK